MPGHPVPGSFNNEGYDPDIEAEVTRYAEKYRALDEQHPDMSDLFYREKNLQRKLYGASWSWDLDTTIKDYAMHLHHETCEMEREVNFKLQTKKRKEIDLQALQSEVVDVFLFGLAAATATFPTYEAFLAAIQTKILYNETRPDWDANHE